jgi:uncharacterized membrane protein
MTRWLALSIALAAAALAASLYLYQYQYDRLPEQVPTHWDVRGQPDRFVPREHLLPYLLIFPGVMAGWVVLTLVLPWISPVHFKVDQFRATYNYIMALAQVLFLYLHAAILAGYFVPGTDVARLLVGGCFLFFALLGNVLGKVRRNFWIGVRTPWTLASEVVWDRTHRLAGWLFVAAGLIGLVAVLAHVPLVVCFVTLIAAALVPVLYSLVLYKRLEREGRLGS